MSYKTLKIRIEQTSKSSSINVNVNEKKIKNSVTIQS